MRRFHRCHCCDVRVLPIKLVQACACASGVLLCVAKCTLGLPGDLLGDGCCPRCLGGALAGALQLLPERRSAEACRLHCLVGALAEALRLLLQTIQGGEGDLLEAVSRGAHLSSQVLCEEENSA